ncbi:MAG TPA: CoA pyrophosphatase [Woeseiaceae bacterium]|jgi:8-oxo-dGTP pyrophosphatase MutT (NUDIX family)|nr:CoA pyrophosphatase [Woeseiaceae bacterium]
MITASKLRQRLAGTREPADPLDVVMPLGSDSWPAGMRERLTATLTPAGVLIPLVDHGAGDLTMLLTERSAELTTHAGQISFPGGRMEAGDPDITVTALRETEEEVGLSRDLVSVIGYLRPMPTITGYAVTPVVGLVESGFELDIDTTEVASAFEAPLAFFLDDRNHKQVERELHGSKVTMVEYHFDGQRIWGATAFIIEKFLKVISKQ